MNVHESLDDKETDFENNKNLTDNVLNTTNHLFSSAVGWKEISENQTRHASSSNLLSITDSVGYLLFKQSKLTKTMQEKIDLLNQASVGYHFGGSELHMDATLRPTNSTRPSNSYCYTFDNSEICLPETVFRGIENDDVIDVSVEYKIDVESNLFPNTVSLSEDTSSIHLHKYGKMLLEQETNTSLNNYFIGLAINNGTSAMDISSDNPVNVTFYHKPTQVRQNPV